MHAPLYPAGLLATALLCGAVPASADSTPRTCGATLADYVGGSELDTAFTGFIDKIPFTVTPEDLAGTVRVEIGPAAVESSAAVGPGWDGSPTFVFSTPRGPAESDSLECNGTDRPSRVTQISGTVLVGGDHVETFVLTRV